MGFAALYPSYSEYLHGLTIGEEEGHEVRKPAVEDVLPRAVEGVGLGFGGAAGQGSTLSPLLGEVNKVAF
jgi:hypothetical protein